MTTRAEFLGSIRREMDKTRGLFEARPVPRPADAGQAAEVVRRQMLERWPQALERFREEFETVGGVFHRVASLDEVIRGRGMERLKGKVAIVTGAGSGIGKALATRLAQDGASVVIADVRNFDLAAADIAKAAGARTLGLQVDVSAEADVARMAAETMKAFGRIDILVNNAAIFSTLELKPFEKIPVTDEYVSSRGSPLIGTSGVHVDSSR